MKKILIALSAAAIFAISCSDDNNNTKPGPSTQPQEGQNQYKTGVDLSASYSLKWDNTGMDDTYFMAGYGYDATGKYAHPAWVRAKVFDLEKYANDYERGAMVVKSLIGKASPGYEGSRAECIEIIASLIDFTPSEISKYKNLFKQTFVGAFVNDTAFPQVEYKYAGYSSMYITYRSKFMHFSVEAINYLTDEFKSDMQRLTAREVIVKYGTHIMTDVQIGKRVDYQYRVNASDGLKASRWLSYTSFHYFTVTSPTVSISRPDGDNPLKENIYAEIITSSQPSPNAWMIDITNYKGKTVVFADEDPKTGLTLVGFGRNSLIPIYSFVADEAKKEELKKAYEQYLSE